MWLGNIYKIFKKYHFQKAKILICLVLMVIYFSYFMYLAAFSMFLVREFCNEIEQIKSQKCLQPTNKLSQLNLFLYSAGLIWIIGRLKYLNLSDTAKHPILLPKDHLITKFLITYFHLKYLYCGQQLSHSLLRQKFWIIRASVAIRRISRSCVICIRYRTFKANDGRFTFFKSKSWQTVFENLNWLHRTVSC